MQKILYLLLLAFALTTACKKPKDDVSCSNAILRMCNPYADKIVVFSWNSNLYDDTIPPSSCVIRDYGQLLIRYDNNGEIDEQISSVSSFNYRGGAMYIELVDCDVSMEAPGGYIDIAHCFNNRFDPQLGELGLNCGGSCKPCKDLLAPCSANLQNKYMKWDGQSSGLTFSYVYDTSFDNKKQYTISLYNGEELIVWLPGDEYPRKNQQFLIGQEYYHADMRYYNRFQYRYPVDSQYIYVNIDTLGNPILEFCDLEFKVGSSSYRASASLPLKD